MVALVDIDDTLAPMQSALLEFINSRVRKPYRFDDLHEGFREGEDKQYQLLVEAFLVRPDLVGEIKPYPYARQSIESLHKAGCQIHIVSSRKEPLHETTRAWLKQHGIARFVDAYHPRPKQLGGAEFKRRIAKKIGAQVAFEDTLTVAQALAGGGIKTYLMDKPWNQRLKIHALIIRSPDFLSATEHWLDVTSKDS